MEVKRVINWTELKVQLTIMDDKSDRVIASFQLQPSREGDFLKYEELLEEGTVIVVTGDKLGRILALSMMFAKGVEQ